MKLLDLFKAVKDETLNKYQLESFHKEMSEVKAKIELELGALKKQRAMFEVAVPEESVASRRRKWQGTAEGQREIELKAMLRATATHLSSLKSRMYANY